MPVDPLKLEAICDSLNGISRRIDAFKSSRSDAGGKTAAQLEADWRKLTEEYERWVASVYDPVLSKSRYGKPAEKREAKIRLQDLGDEFDKRSTAVRNAQGKMQSRAAAEERLGEMKSRQGSKQLDLF